MKISEGVQFEGNITINPPVTIGENTIIRYGCKIGPNVVIGDNVYLEKDVAIKDALIYNKVYIGEGVKNEKAIIADNCRLQNYAFLKGHDKALVILASAVAVLKGVKLINPDDRHITYCHHEVVRKSLE